MAHFRATIHGNYGVASRCGSKASGIDATINGWHIGCRVVIQYDSQRDRDVFTVWKTGGSSDPTSKLIGQFSTPPNEERTNHGRRTQRRN